MHKSRCVSFTIYTAEGTVCPETFESSEEKLPPKTFKLG